MTVTVHFEIRFDVEFDTEEAGDVSSSAEALRAHGAQLGVVQRAARDAVWALPGVRVLHWSSIASSPDRAG